MKILLETKATNVVKETVACRPEVRTFSVFGLSDCDKVPTSSRYVDILKVVQMLLFHVYHDLPVCDTVWSCKWLQTFRGNLPPPSSGGSVMFQYIDLPAIREFHCVKKACIMNYKLLWRARYCGHSLRRTVPCA